MNNNENLYLDLVTLFYVRITPFTPEQVEYESGGAVSIFQLDEVVAEIAREIL